LRIQSKGFELPTPFGWRITQPLDSNAAWQTAFDSGPHEIWCEEREQDRHVDLTQDAQIVELLTVSFRNSQVYDAAKCAKIYLPPLLKSHGHLLDHKLGRPITPSFGGKAEVRFRSRQVAF
jgi:hypothetical protein